MSSLARRLAVPFVSSVTLLAAAPLACSPDTSSPGDSSSGSASGGGQGDGGGKTSSGQGQGGSGGSGTGGSTAASGGSGQGGGATGCGSDADCADDPDGKTVCELATGECVGCLPGETDCGNGQYCNESSKECVPGCADDSGCEEPLVCDESTHLCVGCTENANCAPGTVCVGGTCSPGCAPDQPCQDGATCCGSTCIDLETDEQNCGACGAPCPPPANAEALCVQGTCTLGACAPAFADCNLDPSDGCEWNILQDGDCTCQPGEQQTCYQGAPGTEGKGLCKAGVQTCEPSGTAWGPCLGQVLPQAEICANGIDEDCDGAADNVTDVDGDGWTKCDGDCCETVADGCSDAKLVNPGAFELDGNGVDDNCDGVKDNAVANCDSGLASNSSNGLDYAKAIDLCQTTTENPASLKDKKWGVIKAELLKADGTANPAAASRSIRPGFGTVIKPKQGSSLAVLSTGAAADQSDTNPAYVNFQSYPPALNDMGTTSQFPNDWYAANNSSLPNAPGCPAPLGTLAYNPMMLKLRVRVPTNAKSFSVATYFLSSEFPEWVCTPFNDFFVALLDSTFKPGPGESANPFDKNLAFYKKGNQIYPVGVNLAYGDTGLFTQCKSGPTGCSDAFPGNVTCPSANELQGTGFDIPNPQSSFPNNPGWCGSSNLLGGGTGWLVTSGNVKPGETIEIRFAVWDTSDPYYDSLVLIDNFSWSVVASEPGTHL